MNQGCLSAGNDGSGVPTRIQEMNMFEDILGILQTNWTRVIIPPKCEMHLNATLMSPNLGNKKIVYRQNITDTSNIYRYIRIYIHSRIIYTIMLWSRSWAPRAPISRNDVRICIIVKMMYTHISKLTVLYLFFSSNYIYQQRNILIFIRPRRGEDWSSTLGTRWHGADANLEQ